MKEASSRDVITLTEVSKRYGDNLAVAGFSANFEVGEFVVLLGPSGCGKSTVLKLIAGLEDVTSGEIYIDGELANYIPPKQRDVAMVFQNYALYPHMTVAQNLAFPLKMRKVDKRVAHDRVAEVASMLELSSMLERTPSQLSGGERQRVALGRAVIRNPVAFLMDEPLSNLDALLRFHMRDELLKLHKKMGRTTIYVTHDQTEAMTMADRVIVIKDGRIQQIGSPEDVYTEPANTFVASFIGSPPTNTLLGRTEVDADGMVFLWNDQRIPLANNEEATNGCSAILGVRAEHAELTLDSGKDVVRGVVDLIELIGVDKLVRIEIALDTYWYVRVLPKTDVREGESLGIRVASDSYNLFDPGTGQRIVKVRDD